MSADKMRDAFNAWSPFKWLNEHLPETTSRNQDYSLSHMSSIAFAAWQAASATQAAEIADLLAQLARIEPAEPGINQHGFEVWAKSHGGLPIVHASATLSGLYPATYLADETEIAWRAWANKPTTYHIRNAALDDASAICAKSSNEYLSHEELANCISALKYSPQPIAQPAPSIPEGWQPIETAQNNMVPRLYLIGRYCVQGFVDAAGELMVQSELWPSWRKMRGHPTHWMPLPAAPKQNDGVDHVEG